MRTIEGSMQGRGAATAQYCAASSSRYKLSCIDCSLLVDATSLSIVSELFPSCTALPLTLPNTAGPATPAVAAMDVDTASPGATTGSSNESGVLTFRRLELTKPPAAFWGDLMREAESSITAPKYKKTVLEVHPAEIQDEIWAYDYEQQKAAGAEAARVSVTTFMNVVEDLRDFMAGGCADNNVVKVEMRYVDIKCGDRSGPYDLVHFPHNNTTYAVHSYHNSAVFVLA